MNDAKSDMEGKRIKQDSGGRRRGAGLEDGGGKEWGTKKYKVLKLCIFYVTNRRPKVLQISLS